MAPFLKAEINFRSDALFDLTHDYSFEEGSSCPNFGGRTPLLRFKKLALIRLSTYIATMNLFFLILSIFSLPLSAAFDAEDLKILVKQSESKGSDVLMVWKDGKLLHSKDNDITKQYSIQSVTKSLTALTVSCILRDTPEQLDEPNLFKSWEKTPKSKITLRMLLSMTSGMVDPADPWGNNDFYHHAASQPLTYTPGTKFSYANISPMIVGKWIKETTGQQFSHHIQDCLFDALGITDWRIGKDRKRNEVVAGGMRILAKDLLKVGILLVQDGLYDGQQLYSPKQIQELRKDSLVDKNSYGLSFWLNGKDVYYAAGYLGQYLIMVPSEKLVVLRLRNPKTMTSSKSNTLNWFKELPGLVARLIR